MLFFQGVAKKFFIEWLNFEHMRRTALFIALAVFVLSCVCTSENVTIGSYNISFDLGIPQESYNVNANGPTETVSLNGEKRNEYTLRIKGNNISSQYADILMTEFPTVQSAAAASMSNTEKAYKMMFPTATEISTRKIDGKNGVVAEIPLAQEKMYMASYSPNNHMTVLITSLYPWDEGTLQLLETFHVEKIK
jgi:hypothetical protein